MPRRNGGPLGTEQIARFARSGRGSGVGADYKPWLTVHNVPSRGQSARVLSSKSGRLVHLLSQNEQRYHLILEWSDQVVDIREQYPLLPVDETLDLARRLGVKHPGKAQKPAALTTDFLITVRAGHRTTDRARTLKQRKELSNPRVLEKFEIERRYWMDRGIDWGIVIADDLPLVVCRNLDWLYSYWSVDALSPMTRQQIERLSKAIIERAAEGAGTSLVAMCSRIDSDRHVPEGSSLAVARFLLANKVLLADLSAGPLTEGAVRVGKGRFDDLFARS